MTGNIDEPPELGDLPHNDVMDEPNLPQAARVDISSLHGKKLDASKLTSLVPLLGMFRLQGKPYSLEDYFAMEPMFKVKMPKRILWKCARQISKSTSLAANGTARSASTPFLRTLYVTPRFEQVRRLSSNYVRPFILESPVKKLLVDSSCTQHVLQRSFRNGSTMHFSFAFLDCDRVRGISADETNYDEVQDLDYDFIPVINSCMDASKYGVSAFSGTPKTLDNGIEALWQDSSKAEWVICCDSCGRWNMTTVHADLLKMIDRKGLVCAFCKNLVNPRNGHWYHTDSKNKSSFLGYHVPQVILPLHYSDSEKWNELLDKMDGRHGYNQQKFMNEVLGESADMGVKLITVTDIRNASVLGNNDFRTAAEAIRNSSFRAVGIDWGGGGADEVSYTSVAVVGLTSSGRVQCHYAARFNAGVTHDEEAKEILRIVQWAGAHLVCHDFGGSGSVRETLMIQAGLPLDRVMGFLYVRASTRDMVAYKPPVRGEMRGYYSVDKARSLVLQAVCVKAGAISLPEYESSKNVTHDLLALMEDKHEHPQGSDIYLVRRNPKMSDDFAHALNFACLGIWHATQNYPDLSSFNSLKLSDVQVSLAPIPSGLRG